MTVADGRTHRVSVGDKSLGKAMAEPAPAEGVPARRGAILGVPGSSVVR